MATSITWNGSTYSIPANREPRGWGTSLSAFLVDVGNNALSKAGGNFTLTADANFGATYGLVVKYIKSASSNIAQSGVVRYANNEGIGWRNATNSADKILKVNASDRLDFDGVNVVTATSTDTLTNKTLTSPVISTISNTGTLTLPTSTDTLVGRATTDTLTNKTISGSNNTITNVSLTSGVTGTLPIANGGTGQTAKTAAYDALSPNTTKGDLEAHNGTNNVRVAVGADGTVLTADAASAAGLKWTSPLTNPMTTSGDLIYGAGSGAATRLAGSTSAVRAYLTQTGNGSASAAPAWQLVSSLGLLRYTTSSGYGSTNTCVRRFTNAVETTTDITYADSAANGTTFTIVTAGVYTISYTDQFSAASNFGISVNSAQLTTSITSITAANRIALATTSGTNSITTVSVTRYFAVGDVIRAHGDTVTSGTTPAFASFTIQRVA